MSAEPLEVANLTVAYGATRALDDVTFSAPAGCIVGVIGPNGAGKSTMFRAILGLLPYSGTVRVAGSVAYVPQGDRTVVDFPATALDVALMGTYGSTPWWRPLGRGARACAERALDDVAMTEHRRCTFGELSGGQRQRVIMARALAHGGQVMLLDEPMTGVDATSERILNEVMARLRDHGTTLLVATHDLNDAAAHCDRLLFLNRRITAYGPPDETYTAETLSRTYDGIVVVSDPTGGTIRVLDEGAHHDHAHGGHHEDHHHP